MDMKVLIWDIWGDYGHFRKYFTTSSPLTFSFPPRPTISGMIGALIGLPKEEYSEYFTKDQAYIGVRILKPVKKTRLGINYINTKEAIDMSKIKTRSRVKVELLKEPKYRIYLHHKDSGIYKKVKEFLSCGKNYYTLSLGLSELIANYSFIGEEDVKEIGQDTEFTPVHSVLPLFEELEIKFEGDKEYLKDTVPNVQNAERNVVEYIKVIFEKNGHPIICKPQNYLETKAGERFVFL
ncbi:MAG: CRISPR-associated protein Cas5h [Clostridia bacterium]|nr:CRISPR-associated protein Cas5h [Clostridia bacterium]